MTVHLLVSISCPDRVGLVAAIAGHLFDLGGNLGDTTFAVLGSAAEFISMVEVPEDTDAKALEDGLQGIPELAAAQISVSPFPYAPVHGPSARVTHRITLSGGDRPGLVARLSEAFVAFKANIVRLNAERIPGPAGVQYAVIVDLAIPGDNADACLATVANTAGGLGLACHWESV